MRRFLLIAAAAAIALVGLSANSCGGSKEEAAPAKPAEEMPAKPAEATPAAPEESAPDDATPPSETDAQ